MEKETKKVIFKPLTFTSKDNRKFVGTCKHIIVEGYFGMD